MQVSSMPILPLERARRPRAIMVVLVAGLASTPCSVTVRAAQYQERLLQVDLNRQGAGKTLLLLEDVSGALLASRQELQDWRLREPTAALAIQYQGENWYPLGLIAGETHRLDTTTLILRIEVDPAAFIETDRSAQLATRLVPLKSTPGGFFNYDLFVQHSEGISQHSGQFELGYFNALGVGTATALTDDSTGAYRSTRLETTWTHDQPDSMQSLRLGDSISTPGSWGRPVRFGGIQFGTNFGTQPGFVSFPQQGATGQAVLPSTVDVLVNNAVVSRQNVPPGPFTIANLPVVTGQGSVQLVVRDLFGREQLISQSLYASQTLLRAGLDSVSYEFGAVRNNFGIDSNAYGSALLEGTYRRGLNDALTGELHGEAMSDHAAAGLGADFLLSQLGTVSAYLAGSHASAGNGGLTLLGFDRLADPWSLGARSQWTSRRFVELGLQAPLLPPIQSSSFNVSYASQNAGAIGVAYVMQRNRDVADYRIATLSYSISLRGLGLFTVSALRTLAGETGTTVFALLSIPVDGQTSVSFASQSVRGGTAGPSDDFTTTVQRNLPAGDGYGYRALARTDGSREADYAVQNRIGTYTADIAQGQGTTAVRLEAAGGLAVLDGDGFLSRRIDQSFAVARVADYANVRVLADNQVVGRTDDKGKVLIPRLRPYDDNVLSVDQHDLPLDADIDALKMDAVPYFRSGIDVRFPIRHARGATLNIRLEDGRPLPLDAVVELVGRAEHYPVADEGMVYLTGLAAANRVRAQWKDSRCEFTLPFAASADPLPDLGIFVCQAVRP